MQAPHVLHEMISTVWGLMNPLLHRGRSLADRVCQVPVRSCEQLTVSAERQTPTQVTILQLDKSQRPIICRIFETLPPALPLSLSPFCLSFELTHTPRVALDSLSSLGWP